jgi:hypothetical protein
VNARPGYVTYRRRCRETDEDDGCDAEPVRHRHISDVQIKITFHRFALIG